MNNTVDFDRLARAWLDIGPTELSRGTLAATLTEVHATRQRRPFQDSWRQFVLRGLRATPAAAVLLLASVVVAGTLFTGGFTMPGGGATAVPPTESPRTVGPRTAAPITTQQPSVSVVARLGVVHRGWVYVYEDARVVVSEDGGPLYVRRLALAGLDSVRSGAVSVAWVLDSSLAELSGRSLPPSAPKIAWADRAWRSFEPTTFAVCYGAVDGGASLPASEIVPLLPASLEALLRGKERTYASGTVLFAAPSPDPTPPEECSEVTPATVDALGEAIGGWTWGPWEGGKAAAQVTTIAPPRPPFCKVPACPGSSFALGVSVFVTPVLPHGAPVPWAG